MSERALIIQILEDNLKTLDVQIEGLNRFINFATKELMFKYNVIKENITKLQHEKQKIKSEKLNIEEKSRKFNLQVIDIFNQNKNILKSFLSDIKNKLELIDKLEINEEQEDKIYQNESFKSDLINGNEDIKINRDNIIKIKLHDENIIEDYYVNINKIIYLEDFENISNYKYSNNINNDEITKTGFKKVEDKNENNENTFLNKKKKTQYFTVSKLKSNRPKDEIYKNSNSVVFCAFCNISNKDPKYETKLGPFYGPFIRKGISYFIHESCGMYSPNIYLDDNDKLTNVIQDIKLSKTLHCNLCNKRGATAKCHNKECKKVFHFPCGKEADCIFDNQTFQMHCKDHVRKDIYYHDDINSDIVCTICKSGLDEDILLLCSKCELGYHIYCHKPKLKCVPESDWFCYKCRN